jgi:hypothetical protein
MLLYLHYIHVLKLKRFEVDCWVAVVVSPALQPIQEKKNRCQIAPLIDAPCIFLISRVCYMHRLLILFSSVTLMVRNEEHKL